MKRTKKRSQAGTARRTRDRAERRRLARVKIDRRKKLLREHGLQGGLLYEKHRRKIERSAGYLRDGNAAHHAAVGFRPKTRDRSRCGAVRILSKRDKIRTERLIRQLREET